MQNGNIYMKELQKIMEQDRLAKEKEVHLKELQKQNFNGFD
jgi:hypothetical protein